MMVRYRTPPCIRCCETSDFMLDASRYERWKGGELIQEVWPEYSADLRETLITGIHPECWEELFGE